jgi:hypothetical protein
MPRFSLNIGKLPEEDSYWLCLADLDSTNVYPLAQFSSPEHVTLFEQFMVTQGYTTVKLPTSEELDELLGDN